mgnify:CR=1 FL=1
MVPLLWAIPLPFKFLLFPLFPGQLLLLPNFQVNFHSLSLVIVNRLREGLFAKEAGIVGTEKGLMLMGAILDDFQDFH